MKETPPNPEKQPTSAKVPWKIALQEMAVDWSRGLPKPEQLPASLKDFFRLIVNAKTPADCMRRLRQFLSETMRPEVAMPKDAHLDIPPDRFTDAQREAWAVSQIAAINEGDKRGGFFTKEIWLGMASKYKHWWKVQKSIKARESAKKRKPAS